MARSAMYARLQRKRRLTGSSAFPPEGRLLHVALVSLDHLLDHLAADGTGFAGGQVTVVALLQVDAHFPWCPFYIVNDFDEEVRQAVDCQEQTL